MPLAGYHMALCTSDKRVRINFMSLSKEIDNRTWDCSRIVLGIVVVRQGSRIALNEIGGFPFPSPSPSYARQGLRHSSTDQGLVFMRHHLITQIAGLISQKQKDAACRDLSETHQSWMDVCSEAV